MKRVSDQVALSHCIQGHQGGGGPFFQGKSPPTSSFPMYDMTTPAPFFRDYGERTSTGSTGSSESRFLQRVAHAGHNSSDEPNI